MYIPLVVYFQFVHNRFVTCLCTIMKMNKERLFTKVLSLLGGMLLAWTQMSEQSNPMPVLNYAILLDPSPTSQGSLANHPLHYF
jgi:hypothetical protein